MANTLIPQELDLLIQEFLTDGVLTDKERQVVLRKAEKLGLDRDEIDLYLDAQVQKIDIATDAAVRKQKGKACPYCGGNIPMLAEQCPHCGEHITAQASEELQEIFDNLEEALVELKDASDYKRNKALVDRYARKAKMYYGSNPKVRSLLAEIEIETEKAERRAKSEETKESVSSFLKNRWSWVLIEVVVFASLFFYYHSSANALQKKYNETPTYNYGGEKRKTIWDQKSSAENSMYGTFVVGAIVIGFTVYLARKQNK